MGRSEKGKKGREATAFKKGKEDIVRKKEIPYKALQVHVSPF